MERPSAGLPVLARCPSSPAGLLASRPGTADLAPLAGTLQGGPEAVHRDDTLPGPGGGGPPGGPWAPGGSAIWPPQP